MKRHRAFWVYLVRCADGTCYAGYTNDLQDRLRLHNAGNGAKYLRGKGPLVLVYAKEYRYYKRALNAERQLKMLTREQKEKLVRKCRRRSSWYRLEPLSLARGGTPPSFPGDSAKRGTVIGTPEGRWFTEEPASWGQGGKV